LGVDDPPARLTASLPNILLNKQSDPPELTITLLPVGHCLAIRWAALQNTSLDNAETSYVIKSIYDLIGYSFKANCRWYFWENPTVQWNRNDGR